MNASSRRLLVRRRRQSAIVVPAPCGVRLGTESSRGAGLTPPGSGDLDISSHAAGITSIYRADNSASAACPSGRGLRAAFGLAKPSTSAPHGSYALVNTDDIFTSTHNPRCGTTRSTYVLAKRSAQWKIVSAHVSHLIRHWSIPCSRRESIPPEPFRPAKRC